MHLRSFAAIFLLAFGVSLCMAEKDPYAKATIADPSASFLDVPARRAELAHATTPRVIEALGWKSGCVNSEQPAPPAGRMIIPRHYLSGSNGPINPKRPTPLLRYRKLESAVERRRRPLRCYGRLRRSGLRGEPAGRNGPPPIPCSITAPGKQSGLVPGGVDAQFRLARVVRGRNRPCHSGRPARRNS